MEYAFFNIQESTRAFLLKIIKILERIADALITVVMVYVLIKLFFNSVVEFSIPRFFAIGFYKTIGIDIAFVVLAYFKDILSLDMPRINKNRIYIPIFILRTLEMVVGICGILLYILPCTRAVMIGVMLYDCSIVEFLSLIIQNFVQPALAIFVISWLIPLGIRHGYEILILMKYKKNHS